MSEPIERFLAYTVPGRPVTWQRLTVTRSKRHVVTAEQRAAKQAHAWSAVAALKRRPWPQTGAFAVEVRGYWPDAVVGDCDRLVSLALDALQNVLFVSDRQVRAIRGEVHVDAHSPRTEVTVTRLLADTVVAKKGARKARAA